MCGIFGVLDRDGLNWPSERLLAGNAIAAHRGPDGEGAVWFDTRCDETNAFARHEEGSWSGANAPTLLLCHRRLAIIDLSQGGRQPMSNEDGSLWLTYNGELYNFLELRDELATAGATFRSRSDTEVLLKAYAFWGPDAVTRFAGMWAFALIDFRRRQMLLSRDRFGIKPLHYCKIAGAFAFASEIKQLLRCRLARAQSTKALCSIICSMKRPIPARDLFRRHLQGRCRGTICWFRSTPANSPRARYYALPDQPQVETLSAAQAGRRILRSTQGERQGPPPLRCARRDLPLRRARQFEHRASDARNRRRDRRPRRSSSFNCHFDAPEANEREFTALSIEAAEASRISPNQRKPISRPTCANWYGIRTSRSDRPASMRNGLCFGSFKSAVKVVLDGQGADEMLGGYASTVPHFLLELAGPGRVSRRCGKAGSGRGTKAGHGHHKSRCRQSAGRSLFGREKKERPSDRERHGSPPISLPSTLPVPATWRRCAIDPSPKSAHFANLLYQFFFRNNLPALLRFEDRNSMAFSVEARVPFLDHRLVEFAFSLPSDLKFRGGYTKRVLRDGMAGKLPDALRLRKRKMGFATPEQTWQANVLKELVHEALASEKLNRYLDRENAAAHYRAALEEGALSFAPWRWVNLLLWKQEFQLA